MPELPEVEAARVLVETNCSGHVIEKAVCSDDDKVIEGIAPDELQKMLTGRKLLRACRKGKHMWMELDGGAPALMFHFGMTGFCAIQGIPIIQYVNARARTDEWPPKYCKIILEFEGGLKLAFCDPRRFGRIRLQEDPANNEPISKLGFDPVLEMISLEDLTARLAAQRRAIKTVILDQSFSAGVGNWVADEILHQARIHPEQKANSLGGNQVAALHHQMQDVLKIAVEAGADSEKYPVSWIFHQKWESRGKGPKPKLDGKPIEYITVGGRTSAFVPALQKIPAGAAKPAESAAKGKGGTQNADGGTKPARASKAAAPRGGTRGKAPPAAAEQEDESKVEMRNDLGEKKGKQSDGAGDKPMRKGRALKSKPSPAAAVKETPDEKDVEERTKGTRKAPAAAAATDKGRKRAKKAAKPGS